MKSLKLFIIVGLAFMLGATGAAGAVWYLVQDALPTTDTKEKSEEMIEIQEIITQQETQETQETQNGSIADSIPEEGIALPANALSEEQKAIAESVGIDVDSFMITTEMIECAEEKIGTVRLQEIMDGASPSFLESAKLAPCL